MMGAALPRCRRLSLIGGLDHVVYTAADIEGAYELMPELDLKAVQRA